MKINLIIINKVNNMKIDKNFSKNAIKLNKNYSKKIINMYKIKLNIKKINIMNLIIFQRKNKMTN